MAVICKEKVATEVRKTVVFPVTDLQLIIVRPCHSFYYPSGAMPSLRDPRSLTQASNSPLNVLTAPRGSARLPCKCLLSMCTLWSCLPA